MEEIRSIGVLALRGGEDTRATWRPEPRGPSGVLASGRQPRGGPGAADGRVGSSSRRETAATRGPRTLLLVHTEQERREGVCTGV